MLSNHEFKWACSAGFRVCFLLEAAVTENGLLSSILLTGVRERRTYVHLSCARYWVPAVSARTRASVWSAMSSIQQRRSAPLTWTAAVEWQTAAVECCPQEEVLICPYSNQQQTKLGRRRRTKGRGSRRRCPKMRRVSLIILRWVIIFILLMWHLMYMKMKRRSDQTNRRWRSDGPSLRRHEQQKLQ